MKVKVTKSKKKTYWYNDYIGNEFEVEILNKWNYIVVNDESKQDHYILISDCEILNGSNKPKRSGDNE